MYLLNQTLDLLLMVVSVEIWQETSSQAREIVSVIMCGRGGGGHTDHVPTESDPGSVTDGCQCGDMAGDLITGPGNSESY